MSSVAGLRTGATVSLAALLAFGIGACGSSEAPRAKSPTPEATTSATASASPIPSPIPSPTPSSNPILLLKGRWESVGEFPTDVSSVKVEADGSAVYFAEGDPRTYRGKLEYTGTGGTHRYRLALTGREDGSTEKEQKFTMQIELLEGGQKFAALAEGSFPKRIFRKKS
ncbi:hypothetical protein GCM10027290_42110 [Micromonospora sonneratiae]|uniref:Lipocalin-like domain-containing protein n=1 Tax=Micromonospora sonneratiae TaxID=1184706 RepID=A0ABW3YDY8_9ACTN